MKCPICEKELCWGSDADFDDLGVDGKGIVSFYHCGNCKAEIEIYQREDDENELPELQRENDRPGIQAKGARGGQAQEVPGMQAPVQDC